MPKKKLSNDSFPTKKEIIELLKKENPVIADDHQYSQLMFVLEVKKIRQNVAILKGEYYSNDKLEYRGSLLVPVNNPKSKQPSIYDEMKAGEHKFYGFTLDSREQKIPEKIINLFKRSFEGATLQDFIPFIGGKRTNG